MPTREPFQKVDQIESLGQFLPTKKGALEASGNGAAKAISRSEWNGGYGADSGPSRGDPRRRAIRPDATIAYREPGV